MSNVVESNILIIGKSGVGKSSLLNYIFDKDMEATGTGKPVTEKGIFPHKYMVDEEFGVNLYDTWGLEANKAEEWRRSIQEVVEEHNCKNILDWFHAIFYCFSAKSARIEDFEVDIIRDLIDGGNKVVVIFTHCDTNNIENSLSAMSEKLRTSANVGKEDIILVCSVNKRLLGGNVSFQFGKDEIITKIRQNLWNSICEKIPKEVKVYAEKLLNQWNVNCCNYVEEHTSILNNLSDSLFRRINDYCNDENKKMFHDIQTKFNELCTESFAYYNRMSGKLNVVTNGFTDISYAEDYHKMTFKMDFNEKTVESIANILCFFIPFVGIRVPWRIKTNRKAKIEEKIKECRNKNEELIIRLIKEIEGKFCDIRIPNNSEERA